MTEKELKEIQRLYYQFYEFPTRENARALKSFLNHCSGSINLNKFKRSKK